MELVANLVLSLVLTMVFPVEGLIRPPRAIKVRETTSNAVLFTFNKSPTNGASYEATFTTKRKGISNLGPISIAASRGPILFIAPGLIPDVDYTLSIVAISGSERSTPVTVDVTTSPSIPNGPPQSVTQVSSTSTSITLTWSDPASDKINDRDGITGFRLFQEDQFVAEVTTRRYQFTGLSPGTEYTFKILAVNEQGPAPDRHAASFTGRTAPGVPAPPTFRVILPRFSLAFLIWSEPVPYVGEITKYDIKYTVDGVRLNVPQQSGTTKSYTINNINDHIGKTHAVSIRASTTSGWGDFSEPVEFVFQPIVTVSIQHVNCSTVAVDYIIQPLPGEDNAAQLDQFVLSYHKTTGSSATIELSEDISTNTSSGTVYAHNLEKNTFYKFSYNLNFTGIAITPPGDFPADITYRIPNDCRATTTSLLSTTEVLPTTATTQPSTTTAPSSTTTAPPTTATAPPSTTTTPPSTTTVPPSTTASLLRTTEVLPTTTTAQPSTTTTPSSTTTVPPSTTTAPPSTTTVPPSTTTALPSTAKAPSSTTTSPPSTTTAPPSTTTAPPSTTKVPPSTTTAPPSTTKAPPSTTTAPPSTTTAPPSTTASLLSTTDVRPTTTTTPPSTNAAQPTTTAVTPTTTTALPTTTAVTPTTTTALPTTTAATPTTTAATPTTTPGTIDIPPSSSPTSSGSQCCVSISIFTILLAVVIYLI